MSTSESDPGFKRVGDYVYTLKEEDKPEAVIVFFHGLVITESDVEQAFWSTWTERKDPTKCWPITMLPKYLKEEKKVEDYRIRILAMSYESRQKVPDVAKEGTDNFLLVESFTSDLVTSGFCRNDTDNKDVPIILVGHDMGGILIKNLILKLEYQAATATDEEKKRKLKNFLENLKAVIFYSTPHSGSQAIMDSAKSIKEDTDSLLLELMRVLGTALGRINADFSSYRHGKMKGVQLPRFETYAVYATYKTNQRGFNNVMVVEEGSARHDIDSCNYYSVPKADHFQVCQPEGLWSKSLKLVGDKVHEEISKCRADQETNRNPNTTPQNTLLPMKENNVPARVDAPGGSVVNNYTINYVVNTPLERK